MSFKGYLNTIEELTGKTPKDFLRMAKSRRYLEAGKLRKDVKAGEIIDWLKADFDLGRGHAMSIVALLRGKPIDS